MLADRVSELERIIAEKQFSYEPPGNTYEVSIDVEPHQLLDWDRPLSEQSDAVRAAIVPLRRTWQDYYDQALRSGYDASGARINADTWIASQKIVDPRGASLLREITGLGTLRRSNDKLIERTKRLSDAGIVGIRYLDAGSRSAGDGSRNIVIFPGEEHRIKIVAKNGQPVTGAEREQVLLSMRQGQRATPAPSRAPTDIALLKAEHGLAPAAEMRSAELRRAVEAAIARIAPPDVRARIEDRLTFRGQEVDGWFDPHERLIHISLSAADPLRVATEEAGHALKAAGLLNDSEYALLWAHAERHDLRKQYKIDETYKPIYEPRWKDTPGRLEAALREETIMKMISAHAAGERFGGMVDRILETLAKVLAEVRDALGLKGFRTVHDVFRAIETGEVKGRAEVPGASRVDLKHTLAEADRTGEVKGVADACKG